MGQDSPIASWGRQPFCLIDWHESSLTDIYTLRGPTKIRGGTGLLGFLKGGGTKHRKARFSQEGLKAFVTEQRRRGWLEYRYAPNHEGLVYGLMHGLPAEIVVAPNTEYAVLTSSTGRDHLGQPRPAYREGLYRLSAPNESLIAGDSWRMSYADTLNTIQAEGWELVTMKEYPVYNLNSGQFFQLNFYRRPKP